MTPPWISWKNVESVSQLPFSNDVLETTWLKILRHWNSISSFDGLSIYKYIYIYMSLIKRYICPDSLFKSYSIFTPSTLDPESARTLDQRIPTAPTHGPQPFPTSPTSCKGQPSSVTNLLGKKNHTDSPMDPIEFDVWKFSCWQGCAVSAASGTYLSGFEFLRTCGSCGRSLKQSAHRQKVTSWFVTQNDLQKHSPHHVFVVDQHLQQNQPSTPWCLFLLNPKKQPSTTQNSATKSFKKETYIWVHLVASFGFLTSGSTILCLQQILPLPTLQASSYKWSDIRWGHPSPLSMGVGWRVLAKINCYL